MQKILMFRSDDGKAFTEENACRDYEDINRKIVRKVLKAKVRKEIEDET